MTDEEIRNAFRFQPWAAVVLLVAGYAFMFAHADRNGIFLFTLGVAAIGLNVLLAEHAIRHDRWWSIPSLLLATTCAFGGALAIIISMAPYLS